MWAVRDPTSRTPAPPTSGCWSLEPEFAQRPQETTSARSRRCRPTLRYGWDGRPLQLLTRTAPARATDTHISVIGHITATELRRHATSDRARQWLHEQVLDRGCRRVRLLPEGGKPDPLARTGLPRYLASALQHARSVGQLHFDPQARELWWHSYPQLSEPQPTGSPATSPPAPKRTRSGSR